MKFRKGQIWRHISGALLMVSREQKNHFGQLGALDETGSFFSEAHLTTLLYDPSEPKVGPVVPWPKVPGCPVNADAYLEIVWLNGDNLHTTARMLEWNPRLPRKSYQVLWSPDAKDYEMPKPKVEVRWCCIQPEENISVHNLEAALSADYDWFIRCEFCDGKLIGQPVVLTREEVLEEVEGE